MTFYSEKSGQIKALQQVLKNLLEDDSYENAKLAHEILDDNRDGQLCYKEFTHLIRNVYASNPILVTNPELSQKIGRLFDKYDSSQDGALCFNEFRDLLLHEEILVGAKSLKRLFECCDADKDGKISKHDFLKVLSNKY